MQQKKSKLPVILIAAVVVIGLVVLGIFMLRQSPSEQAREAVETFYDHEQKGEFASSWQLFHPLMKEKFAKGHYIQDRAHVFMNHFGVTTFTYSLSDMKKIEGWSMTKEAEPINIVYATTVTQTYKGKYGNFALHQEVFAAKVKEEWKILWDYKK